MDTEILTEDRHRLAQISYREELTGLDWEPLWRVWQTIHLWLKNLRVH
jgi:hypothetical protein